MNLPASWRVWPRPLVFLGIAGACLGGIGFVRALARSGAPADLATTTLAVQTALAVLCALLARSEAAAAVVVRWLAMLGIGLLTAGVTYFFGPHSGMGALVALLLVETGILTGDGPGRYPVVAGWLAYLALAASQAITFTLIAARVWPDGGISRTISDEFPIWQLVLVHASLQGVFLVAFLAGRGYARRYRALAREVDETLRATARREALLEEARAEYKLALAAGRQELLSSDGGEHRKRAPTGSEGPEGVALAEAALGRPLAAAAAEALIGDVSRALEALHAQGAVHLDVTPASIARVRADSGELRWKLLDFAEAQRLAGGAGQGDPTAAMRYLAPERLRGQFADARADLYGLCASVYFALAGKEPFAEAAPHEVAEAVMSRLPRPIDALSPPIAAVLARGLARSPANRFATPAELRDAFAAAFREAAFHDASTPEASGEISGSAEISAPSTPIGRPRPRRPSLVQRAASVSDTVRRAILGDDGTSASETPATSAWQEAYVAKMRGFVIGVTIACASGCLMLGVITRADEPRIIALACLAGIAGIMWLHWFLIRRGDTGVYWPLAIAGALTTGPAYAFGLHSAFGSVITVLLFAGGLFRGTLRTSWADRRGLVLGAICVAYTTVLLLIVTGVLPDRGNMDVIEPTGGAWEPLIKHIALLVVFAGAFFGGAIVDRNYQALMHRAETSAREAAAKEALLASARAELDALLANAGGGLFTGTCVAGYRVGPLIGRGGMGEVYRATDEQSGDVVAIKLLKRERIGDLRALRRFMVEATALARVRSPYVAAVRRVAHPEDDLPFFAMEHIDGVSLSSMLRARERLDLPLVQSIVHDIGRGLQDVHRAGVVHRDVKPNNILFTTETGGHCWKLVDFGAAKLLDDGGSGAAQSVVIGTPRYMAPEQAMAGRADARSDLYSLGVVIYGALTGRPAFTGHDPAEIARQALTVGPPDPAQFADLPPAVTICLRIGLAAQPEDRFATASELLAAFEGAFDGALDRRVRERGLELLRRAPWAR